MLHKLNSIIFLQVLLFLDKFAAKFKVPVISLHYFKVEFGGSH